MGVPQGFTFDVRKSGEVVIKHFGRVASVLRGKRAYRFIADAESGDVDRHARMAR